MAALACVLAACSPVGDFGRPKLDLTPLGSTIADHSDRPQWWRAEAPPNLTEDERELRNRAWRFLRRFKGHGWHLYADSAAPDIAEYYEVLVARRPPDAAWARLLDDIATDAGLIGAFFEVATRVERIDIRRAAAPRRSTPASRDAAEDLSARLAENEDLTDTVEDAAWTRFEAYKYAAERLAAEAPSPAYRKARSAIRTLRRTLLGEPPPPPPEPLVIRAGGG